MESFQFLDIDWEGKMEPTSPASQHSSYAEELILEDYDFCNEGLFNNALFDIVVETKPVIKSDLLKDTPIVFALPPVEKVEKDQWLGEKLKVPQLSVVSGGYAPPLASSAAASLVGIAPEIGPFPHQRQPEKVQNTEELLMEFDYVYGNVELTHLTPPQTPPQEAQFGSPEQPTYLTLPSQPLASAPTVVNGGFYGYGSSANGVILPNLIPTVVEQHPASVEPLQQVPGEYQLADSFGFQPVDENIARDMELVEEIVRSRSKDLPDCNDEDSCSFSEAGSVSSSCPMSDASSSYCGSAYSRDQDDDEWSPASSGSTKKNSISRVSGGGVSKKRTRPYGRGIEDKKSRKKEQNKNAATRYRQKKKAEIEEILIVERDLKEKNEGLKSKSADLGREIRYLKSLMREICKAKGLL